MTSLDESDEEYLDDPIQLDFQQKVTGHVCNYHNQNNETVFELTDPEGDLYIEKNNVFQKTVTPCKKVSITLPVSFFEISRNVQLLNSCKQVCINVVNCEKYPWYHKKVLTNNSNDTDEEVDYYNNKGCNETKDIEIQNYKMIEGEKKIKIRPVNSPYKNLKVNNPKNKPKVRNKQNSNAIAVPNPQIDFKKNQGLIGMKIVQTAVISSQITTEKKNITTIDKTVDQEKRTEEIHKDKLQVQEKAKLGKNNNIVKRKELTSRSSATKVAKITDDIEKAIQIQKNATDMQKHKEVTIKETTPTKDDSLDKLIQDDIRLDFTEMSNIGTKTNIQKVMEKAKVNETKIKKHDVKILEKRTVTIVKGQDTNKKMIINNTKSHSDKSNTGNTETIQEVEEKVYQSQFSSASEPKIPDNMNTNNVEVVEKYASSMFDVHEINKKIKTNNSNVATKWNIIDNTQIGSETVIKRDEFNNSALDNSVLVPEKQREERICLAANKDKYNLDITYTTKLQGLKMTVTKKDSAEIMNNTLNIQNDKNEDNRVKGSVKKKELQNKKASVPVKTVIKNDSSKPKSAQNKSILNMQLFKTVNNKFKKCDSDSKIINKKEVTKKQLNKRDSDTNNYAQSGSIKLLSNKIITNTDSGIVNNRSQMNVKSNEIKYQNNTGVDKSYPSHKSTTVPVSGNGHSSSFYINKYNKIMQSSSKQDSDNVNTSQTLSQPNNSVKPGTVSCVIKKAMNTTQNQNAPIEKLVIDDNPKNKMMPENSTPLNLCTNNSVSAKHNYLSKNVKPSASMNLNSSVPTSILKTIQKPDCLATTQSQMKPSASMNLNLSAPISIQKTNQKPDFLASAQSVMKPSASMNLNLSAPISIQKRNQKPDCMATAQSVMKPSASMNLNSSAPISIQKTNQKPDCLATTQSVMKPSASMNLNSSAPVSKQKTNQKPDCLATTQSVMKPSASMNLNSSAPVSKQKTNQKPDCLATTQSVMKPSASMNLNSSAPVSKQKTNQKPDCLATTQSVMKPSASMNLNLSAPFSKQKTNQKLDCLATTQSVMKPSASMNLNSSAPISIQKTNQKPDCLATTQSVMKPSASMNLNSSAPVSILKTNQKPDCLTAQTEILSGTCVSRYTHVVQNQPPHIPLNIPAGKRCPRIIKICKRNPAVAYINTTENSNPTAGNINSYTINPITKANINNKSGNQDYPIQYHPIQTLVNTRSDMPNQELFEWQQNQATFDSQMLSYSAKNQISQNQNIQQLPFVNQTQQPILLNNLAASRQVANPRYKTLHKMLPPTCDIAMAKITPGYDAQNHDHQIIPNVMYQPQQQRNMPTLRFMRMEQRPGIDRLQQSKTSSSQNFRNLKLLVQERPKDQNNYTVTPRQAPHQNFFPHIYGHEHRQSMPYGESFQQAYSDFNGISPQNYIHCAPIYDGLPNNMNPTNQMHDNMQTHWGNLYNPVIPPPPPPPPPLPPPPVFVMRQGFDQMSGPYQEHNNSSAPKSVAGTTIIGHDDTGPVRKININVEPLSNKLNDATQQPSKQVNINGDATEPFISGNCQVAYSKKEMLEELTKITTLESSNLSPVKDLKRPLSKTDTFQETSNIPNTKRPKPGPLSRKQPTLDSATSSEVVSINKGNSPPILPVLTYQNPFKNIAKSNISDPRLSHSKSQDERKDDFSNAMCSTEKANHQIQFVGKVTKRKCSFDENQDTSAKKISLDEYNKKYNKKELEPNIRDWHIDNIKMEIKIENPEQDLGYDSDSTMKL